MARACRRIPSTSSSQGASASSPSNSRQPAMGMRSGTFSRSLRSAMAPPNWRSNTKPQPATIGRTGSENKEGARPRPPSIPRRLGCGRRALALGREREGDRNCGRLLRRRPPVLDRRVRGRSAARRGGRSQRKSGAAKRRWSSHRRPCVRSSPATSNAASGENLALVSQSTALAERAGRCWATTQSVRPRSRVRHEPADRHKTHLQVTRCSADARRVTAKEAGTDGKRGAPIDTANR